MRSTRADRQREHRGRVARTALGLGAFLVLVAGVQLAESARFEGAAGFKRAMRRHERTGKPLLLFVYTDWCPHCRTFINKTLRTPTVRRYMNGILEVWLNPERGTREESLARKYGVRGYPTLFMFPWNSQEPLQIKRSADPSAFVRTCQIAAGTPPGDATSASVRTPPPREPSTRPAALPPVGPTVTVYLTSGEVVKGQLVGETPVIVLIETDSGQMTYFREMIDRVVTDAPSAAQSGHR